MEMLSEYIVPVIVVACLVVGYVVKHWINDIDNKWIPTIVCVLGIVLAAWNGWPDITLSTLVGGAVSGLLSTGLHQLFKQWIANGGASE